MNTAIIKPEAFLDNTDGKLEKIEVFAATHPQGTSFVDCITRLEQICINYPESHCALYTDFAPNSLGFTIFKGTEAKPSRILTGAIIFHGHDGGSGAGPSFSVTLDPCLGWAIHT